MNADNLSKALDDLQNSFEKENLKGVIAPSAALLRFISLISKSELEPRLNNIISQVNCDEVMKALEGILTKTISFFEKSKDEYGEYYELDYFDLLNNLRIDFDILVNLQVSLVVIELYKIETDDLEIEIERHLKGSKTSNSKVLDYESLIMRALENGEGELYGF